MDKPLVNSWTEFGELEYVCVGTANDMHYPEREPFYRYNVLREKRWNDYLTQPIGPRPIERIRKAEEELEYLRNLLEGEQICVATVTEFESDIKEDLKRKRSFLFRSPKSITEDRRVRKQKVNVIRAPEVKLDHLILTPWFKNYYQFGLACPRDMLITFGNTILEAAPSSRCRYFESSYYREIINKYFDEDPRVHWKAAPHPTCADSMFRYYYLAKPKSFTILSKNAYETPINESEVIFDAADMMRIGKDVFYKRSVSANCKGIKWLRREFSDLRFHMLHFPDDISPHMDVNIAPLRPPTSGSDGIMLINQICPPLASEMRIFKENDWKLIWGPKPATNKTSPVAACSECLNMNFLMLSTKCALIEECEVALYNQLEDLGFDVITCPLRTLNEFGGGPHCVTWDIRRDDECKDYFPNQNYEAECAIDLTTFNDTRVYKE